MHCVIRSVVPQRRLKQILRAGGPAEGHQPNATGREIDMLIRGGDDCPFAAAVNRFARELGNLKFAAAEGMRLAVAVRNS